MSLLRKQYCNSSVILAAAFLSVTAAGQTLGITSNSVSSIAGGGSSAIPTYNSGSGVLATTVSLMTPSASALDSQGNVYLSDVGDNTVLMIYHGSVAILGQEDTHQTAVPGDIYPLAGQPSPAKSGYGGDGGLASSATLSGPRGIFVDAAFNVYIADSGNGLVRVIYEGNANTACLIIIENPTDFGLLAGATSCSGATSQPAVGHIYTIAGGTGSGSTGTLATSQALNSPRGIYVDSSSDVYIADINNNRVTVVYAGGTAAGSLITEENSSYALGVGNMYTIAGNGKPQSGTSGSYSIGDGGLALLAAVNNPSDISFDDSGNMYITEFGGDRVRKVTASTGYITTICGFAPTSGDNNLSVKAGLEGDGGLASDALLNGPRSVTVDSSGNIYVADSGNNVVREIDTTLRIDTVAGAGDGTAGYNGDGYDATAESGKGTFNGPSGVVLDASSNLYIADYNNNRLREVTLGQPNIVFPTTVYGTPTLAVATLTNTGTTSSITLTSLTNSPSGVQFSGTNRGDFSVQKGYGFCFDSDGNGATLAVGKSCTLGIAFTPKGPANTVSSGLPSRTATVVVTDTSNSNTASATLTGTISPRQLTVSAQEQFLYGGTPPASPTPTYSVLVAGDTSGNVFINGGQLATGVPNQTAVGTYPITVGQGTLALQTNMSEFYTLDFVPGLLSIFGYHTSSTGYTATQPTPYFTIYGYPPAVSQGPNVADRIGIVATGMLYQYDPTISSLEEAQDMIGTNGQAFESANLPVKEGAGLGSHVIKVWFSADDLNVQGYPNPGTNHATYPNMNLSGSPKTCWTLPGGSCATPYLPATLAQLAQSPPMAELFSNPDFDTYILEAFEFPGDCNDQWNYLNGTNNWGAMQQACVYDEFYDLATYLIKTYGATTSTHPKTFILQNWEGDNALSGASFTNNYGINEDCEAGSKASQGTNYPELLCETVVNMAQWLNLRWEGVNDARRDNTSATYPNATVAAAAEVNMIHGAVPTSWNAPLVMDLVIPYLHMDLYSCSCYWSDSTNEGVLAPQQLPAEMATYSSSNNIFQPQSNRYTSTYDTVKNASSLQSDEGTPLFQTGTSPNFIENDLMIGEFGSPENHYYKSDSWLGATQDPFNTNSNPPNVPTEQAAMEVLGQQIAGILSTSNRLTGSASVHTVRYGLYWALYPNFTEPYVAPSGASHNTIQGYWLVRPPCNATDDAPFPYTQGWCADASLSSPARDVPTPPSIYDNADQQQLTNSWNYLSAIMAQPLSTYQNVYEAEDNLTGFTTNGGTVVSNYTDSSVTLSGNYATQLQNAAAGDTLTYSLFTPYIPGGGSTAVVSITVETGPNNGQFKVSKNGVSYGTTCNTYTGTAGVATYYMTSQPAAFGTGTHTFVVTYTGPGSGGSNLVIDSFSITQGVPAGALPCN